MPNDHDLVAAMKALNRPFFPLPSSPNPPRKYALNNQPKEPTTFVKNSNFILKIRDKAQDPLVMTEIP